MKLYKGKDTCYSDDLTLNAMLASGWSSKSTKKNINSTIKKKIDITNKKNKEF